MNLDFFQKNFILYLVFSIRNYYKKRMYTSVSTGSPLSKLYLSDESSYDTYRCHRCFSSYISPNNAISSSLLNNILKHLSCSIKCYNWSSQLRIRNNTGYCAFDVTDISTNIRRNILYYVVLQ